MKRCIFCRYCIDVAPRNCIKLVSEVETDRYGAVSGLVETKNWKDVGAVVIDNARCIRCGACMKVCPTNVINPTLTEAGMAGFWTPHLIMTQGYCEYTCTLCGSVCPTGAITIKDEGDTRIINMPNVTMDFKLKKCKTCGAYWAPERQLDL